MLLSLVEKDPFFKTFFGEFDAPRLESPRWKLKDERYSVLLEFAGFRKEDLKATLQDARNLRLEAVRKDEFLDKLVSKVISLPRDASTETLDLSLENGLLLISVARSGPFGKELAIR